MRLHIETVGEHRVPKLRRVWSEFETAVALPFSYERPATFGTFADAAVSRYAAVRVRDGVATLRVLPRTLDSEDKDESRLTLLHETVHIAGFAGWLRALLVDVDKIRETYSYAEPYAPWLANYMFEIDAELWLTRIYPADAEARARYLIKIICDDHEPHDDVPEKVRPYCELRDLLSAELAGVLTRDAEVEATLIRRLGVSPNLPQPVKALHQLLSPKLRDYGTLPEWGATAYEQTLQTYIDDVQRQNPVG